MGLIRSLSSTLRVVLRHPLSQKDKPAALRRYISWQIGSYLLPGSATIVPFINETRLVVSRGMTGATMHVYTGLSDFPDCGFLLHLLRPDDLFVDIGANVGVYTVLAAGAVGARAITIEPVPSTFQRMLLNLNANRIENLVTAHNIGLGRANETLHFTADQDTANRVITDAAWTGPRISVPVRRLDDVLTGENPVLIKMDVEGWESEVLAGSQDVLGRSSLLGLIVEMNGDSEEFSANERAVHDGLKERNFAPYAYDPFTRELTALPSKNVGYTNTIYLRNVDEVRRRIASASPFHVLGQAI